MVRPFHLALFSSFHPPAWEEEPDHAAVADWASGDFHVAIAQKLERACFDLIMLEDTLSVPDAYGRSMDAALRRGFMVPKGDPTALAVKLAAFTRHLGVVATMSTSFYPPFHLARLSSTIDAMSRGRFGWNIVSTSEDRAAQNFGLPELHEHDSRYDRADDFLEAVTRLWESWEPDAVVLDRERRTFVDPEKVHVVDHVGPYFSTRGPLTMQPMPQGRPTLLQAGVSPRGRAFSSRHADAVISIAGDVSAMAQLRADIRARAEAWGRDPDDVKVLFLVTPVVAASREEALEQWSRQVTSEHHLEHVVMGQSMFSDIDFGHWGWDEIVPADLTTNGGQGSLANFLRGDGTPGPKTLRQLATAYAAKGGDLVGTPAEVADAMEALMEAVGGDGFLLEQPGFHSTHAYVDSLCDLLVPELQRRGLTRTAYTQSTLRATLREF